MVGWRPEETGAGAGTGAAGSPHWRRWRATGAGAGSGWTGAGPSCTCHHAGSEASTSGEGGGRSRVPERGAPPRWRAARARPPCAARGARWRAPAPACASGPSPRRRWTPSTRGRMGDGRFRDGFGSADPRDGTRVRACEGGTTASAIGMPTTVGRGGERDVRTTTRRAAGPSGTSNASREREARAPRATGRPRRLRRLGARRSDGHRSRASERGTIVWTPRRTHLASLGGRAYLVRRYHRAGDDRGRHGAVVVVLRARVARSRVSSRGARVMRSRPRLPRSLTRRAIGHNSGKAPPRTIAILIFSAEGGRG